MDYAIATFCYGERYYDQTNRMIESFKNFEEKPKIFIVTDKPDSIIKEDFVFVSNIKEYDNHLNYFFKYTPFLNQWRFNSTIGVKDHCIDPYKILKKTDNVFEYSIDKIEYGCSYIAIHKKLRKHWIV